MSLIALILALTLIGLALYCIVTWIPMEPTIKRVLVIAVLIVVVLWLMSVFGVLDELRTIRVPKL
jgi:hypothetical protein